MSSDVFAQSVGTISRHSTLQDAIKTAIADLQGKQESEGKWQPK